VNRAAALACMLVGAGCSASSGEAVKITAPTRPSEFIRGQYQITCEVLDRCCSSAQKRSRGWSGIDACTGAAFATGASASAMLDARVASGTVLFDAGAAASCLAAARAAGADCAHLMAPLPGSCANVIRGTAAPGDACAPDPPYCAPSAYCDQSEGIGGSCRPRAASGQSCVEGQCAAGLGCQPDGRCGPTLPDGQKCQTAEQCASGGCSPAGVCGPAPFGAAC
jgi:hypothetical protein